jgi:hypothetical protein
MRRELCHQAVDLAAEQDGITSRRQLREFGLSRFDVRTEIRAGRWQMPSPMTIAVFTGALSPRQQWWVSLLETGCQAAALDGATALQAAGLKGYETSTTISCPHGAKPRRPDRVAVHVTEWRHTGDLIRVGIPRVRPEAAAVRGALWAGTDRQAALILVLAVQQRLTTATRMAAELGRIQRHPRRRLLNRLVADIADGAQALGELDFATLCRQYGLPRPSRQVLRPGPEDRSYLDVYFDDYGLVVEIDGIHHLLGLNPLDDALRQNELTLVSDAVLRIPLLGVRLQPARFMAQLVRGLHDRGWNEAA